MNTKSTLNGTCLRLTTLLVGALYLRAERFVRDLARATVDEGVLSTPADAGRSGFVAFINGERDKHIDSAHFNAFYSI